MNKIYILIIISNLCSNISSKYESSYYKNTTNILEKYPKIDIDYIFSRPEENNEKEQNENKEQKDQKDLLKDKQINNPSSNIFLNIFYDFYKTSVPLYEEKMKCYFPIKKNISIDINNEYYNITKIKNISTYFGKSFIKSLKGRCERFYIERWYYTLCPLVGAKQTLSYIKPNDNKKKDEEEKQEVNYLGYEINYNDNVNYSSFIKELYGDFKSYAAKKYFNEIMDIKEENLFNNYGKKNKIIGIHKNIIKFYGENVFDSNKYLKYNKNFILEYSKYSKNEQQVLFLDKKAFKTNIIKVINNNLILVNHTFDKNEALKVVKVQKIKIFKNLENNSKNQKHLDLFFNQSFFVYDEYLYTSKLNLAACTTMSCYITISDDKNVYKLDTIVDSKLAILEKGIDKKNDLGLYNPYANYLIFFGDEKHYFLGQGEVEELTEEVDSSSIFILAGKDLDIEKSDGILIPFNDTIIEFNNYIFINDIFNNKFFSFEYKERINRTHFKLNLLDKSQIKYLEKDITLDGRYIIIKNNKNKVKKEEEKKEEAKYIIIGNEKNISLDNNYQEKKEKIKIEKPIEEFHPYKIPNTKEFIFNFNLFPYNYNSKDSYITICFSTNEKCKKGEDYEMLIDIKNEGLLIQKISDDESNKNNSLIYSMFKFKNVENIIKSSIIFFNSTIYFNTIYKEENNLVESEIKLKFRIKNESYNMNYIIINKNKSNNIYMENTNFEEYVSFDLFKNIFIYEQKFLLDDKTMYIDTFESGDYCQPIKSNRRVIIYYTCDEEGIYELKLTNVFEDKKNICVYHYYAKSKYLCNPNTLMKNYVKFSGLKTYCYLDN